jgi:hypothetical protein
MPFTMQLKQQGEPLNRLDHQEYETLYDESTKSPTMAVTSRLRQEKSERLQRQHSSQQKSVRFNEQVNEYHNGSILLKEDLQDVWYSARDFQQFLSSTRNYGREMACNERNDKSIFAYHGKLEETYEACCRFTSEHDLSTMEGNNHACTSSSSILTLQKERDLQQCIDVSTSCLGIERLAILSIGTDCSQRKQELHRAVFDIQEQGLLNSNNNSAHARQHHAELIRQASEKCSQASRLFFQLLAQALAHTVYAAEKV